MTSATDVRPREADPAGARRRWLMLVRVPLHHAADASGLLTTTIQLSQAIGVATFGSLFLTLSTRPGPVVSGHALATTMTWLAAVMVLSVLAGIPLARTVAAARR